MYVGPMKVKTFGDDLYFVTFVDDHSRKFWAYALKSKDQVLEVFKQFHVMVKRQTRNLSTAFGQTMVVNLLGCLISIASCMEFDMEGPF